MSLYESNSDYKKYIKQLDLAAVEFKRSLDLEEILNFFCNMTVRRNIWP